MQRVSAISFCLALIFCAQLCTSIKCYLCVGYDDSQPYNSTFNTPSCQTGAFDASNVTEYEGEYCFAFTFKADGKQATVRGPQNRKLMKSYVFVEGYACDDGDYCNSKDTNAAGYPSFALPLLLVPVLLQRLFA